MERRILCFVMVLVLSIPCVTFAAESNVDEIYMEGGDNGYVTIVIKGEENIKAYEDAGFIRSCDTVAYNGIERASVSRGTTIPTRVYNLVNNSRNFSYSFMNYIYSNYLYKPAPDSLAASGYAIYHSFTPSASQSIGLDVYSNTNSLESSINEKIDAPTVIARAVKAGTHYIKYRSVSGKKISGSCTVY